MASTGDEELEALVGLGNDVLQRQLMYSQEQSAAAPKDTISRKRQGASTLITAALAGKQGGVRPEPLPGSLSQAS